MAKGDKGEDKGDDYQFVPPDFDEDAFIHKEMVLFRAGLTAFILGVVCALLGWAMFAALDGSRNGWFLGLLVVLLTCLALRPIFRVLKIDTSTYTKKNWFGAYFFVFVSFLALFIVLVNPPVGDYSPPHAYIVAQPAIQQEGSPVNLTILATDNVAVTRHEFRITGPNGQQFADDSAFVDKGNGRFEFAREAVPSGDYIVIARVWDAKGHDGAANGTLTVKKDALSAPSRTTLGNDELLSITASLDACDPSHVASAPCLRTVVLQKDDGTNITLGRSLTDARKWEVRADAKGWVAGNNTVHVVAQQAAFSIGNHKFDSQEIRRPDAYTVTVTGTLGSSVATAQDPLLPKASPGAGLWATIAVLGAAAFVRSRRQA